MSDSNYDELVRALSTTSIGEHYIGVGVPQYLDAGLEEAVTPEPPADVPVRLGHRFLDGGRHEAGSPGGGAG
ncbi:MAG: hypothetical protein IPN76_03495 [Saprospiraceae bacterium]|nr:hypothetical protein [Saprospiraceae bacterium]